MRGKASRVAADTMIDGITPAYAGKSQIIVNLICGKQDHPRLCGEKHRNCHLLQALPGSPPPMRGKAASNRVDMDSAGITPAYAGKRKLSVLGDPHRQDHPRLCGEKPV